MMALFGMVWLLKVRKHLRHCAHCRAHLRTCAHCRARPSPSLPSIINSRDSTKESCAQDTASQTSPPEHERGRITLDLVAHRPPREDDSDEEAADSSGAGCSADGGSGGHDTGERTAGDPPGVTECNESEAQYLPFAGRVSPSLPAPPPPPPRSPAPPRDVSRSPRRLAEPAVSVAQQPCESAAGSLASRVCSMYDHEDPRRDLAKERRRSFGSTKRRSLPSAEDLEVKIDAPIKTATLPRQASTGGGSRFCYNPGHTHPYACTALTTSTPHLSHLSRSSHNNSATTPSTQHTWDHSLPGTPLPFPHHHTSPQPAYQPHTPQPAHSVASAHAPSWEPPQVTLDPRCLPTEPPEGAYGGSDSSRSSHSGSRSSYSDHSLPPPLKFSEGAIHFMPTPAAPPLLADAQYEPLQGRSRWPQGDGGGRRSWEAPLVLDHNVQFRDGVWSIPTSSTVTTFLGADYPRYDPTTVPGRDRRSFGQQETQSSPHAGQGTLPRACRSSRGHRSPGHSGRSHSRSPSRHRGRVDLLEACEADHGGPGGWDAAEGVTGERALGARATWERETRVSGESLPPPPVEWSSASPKAGFCALHGYSKPKGKLSVLR